MFMYMQYGPYICIGAILAILFILWAFWGGKNYEFIGLAPLSPETCGSYTGSLYNWGNITPATDGNDISGQYNLSQTPESTVAIDNTPAIPDEFKSENITQIDAEVSDREVIHMPEEHITPLEDTVCLQTPMDGLPVILDHIPVSYKSRLPSVTQQRLPQPSNPTALVQNRGRFVSRGERMCCYTMASIYGVPFSSVRPDWLENPETGEKLELDCYNDELKIAVEYNGEQHYKWPNFTNQTYQQFINQVRRDEYKMDECDRNGVYLIVVPFNVPYENIPAYIMSHLPETIQKRLQEERTLVNIG